MSFNRRYDPVDQLLAATVRSNSPTGAIFKQFFYGYDKAGNRTSEQIDSGLASANYNAANQLPATNSDCVVLKPGWQVGLLAGVERSGERLGQDVFQDCGLIPLPPSRLDVEL